MFKYNTFRKMIEEEMKRSRCKYYGLACLNKSYVDDDSLKNLEVFYIDEKTNLEKLIEMLVENCPCSKLCFFGAELILADDRIKNTVTFYCPRNILTSEIIK